MTSFCPGPEDVTGVAHGVLASVGCNSEHLALKAYAAFTGPTSFLPTALTICLTLYVGLLGFGLLTGSGGLNLAGVSKSGLKIGAIVALTLNWNAFQTLVFNVAMGAPAEVGRIFGEAARSEGPGLFQEDPLNRLEAVHQELTDSAQSLRQATTPAAQQGAAANSVYTAAANQSPAAGTLQVLATILILSTVGLIALAMVVQAILVALGPAFVLCLLFEATRGLFVGWLRALVAAVIAPITSWGGLMVCLATLEPWIEMLADERDTHSISSDTISSLTTFIVVFAGAQLVMALGAVVVTSAFHLPRARQLREPDALRTETTQNQSLNARFAQSRAEQLVQSLPADRTPGGLAESRRIEVNLASASRSAEGATSIDRGVGGAFRRPSPTGRLAPATAASRSGGQG
ncbi:MAG TPA: type IV secretion system protein [Phenylobacterium sp.]|jgi:type IV secretion system protein VirB6|nr:type IV secretion system protein [Phenylobacterium sp.]